MLSAIKIFNKPSAYGGSCYVCGTKVAAGAGRLAKDESRGKWLVCCEKDVKSQEAAAPPPPPPAAAAAAPTADIGVDLSPDGKALVWRLLGRLGDRFALYRNVKDESGLRSKKDARGEWYDYCDIPKAGNIHAALVNAGFKVVVSPAAAAAIKGASEQQKAVESATQTRLDHPNAAGLFPFQRVGVQWLAARMNAILADEMGCGKTVQTLMALPSNAPVILVVPSAVKWNWKKEAAKWRPEFKTEVLSGRTSFRYPQPGEMVIINYDILPKAPEWKGYGDLPALTGPFASPPAGLCIVADEAHMVKTSDAQRTRNFRFLRAIANEKGGSCWLLTGTPLLNRPLELWNIFSSAGVHREAFGNFDNFKRLFHATEGRWGIEWGDPMSDVPLLMRRVQLRREKKDVLKDLPAKTRQYISIPASEAEITAKEAKLLAAAADKMPSDQELEVLMEQAMAENAEELPSFPGFEQFSEAYATLGRIKLRPTLKYIEQYVEEKQPFLVFAHHVDVLKAIQKALEEKGLKCGLIIGSTDDKDRSDQVDAFQAGKLDCMAISIIAGGVGITLTRASNSIFLEPALVPGLNVQAEDRVHRIGQTMPVTIRYMVLEHPFDERIQALLRRKEALIKKTTEASTVLPTDNVVGEGTSSALEQMLQNITISDRVKGQAREAVGGKGNPEAGGIKSVTYRTQEGEEREVDVPLQARPPKTALELWAMSGLSTLVAYDDDHARDDNGVGFSKSTGRWGHRFNALAQSYGLTDEQWKAAIEICTFHKKQIGRPPVDRPLTAEEVAMGRGTALDGLRRYQRSGFGGLLGGLFGRWR